LANTIVDRCALGGARRRTDHLLVGAARRGSFVERGEIGHRHLDRHLHGLRRARLDDLDRAGAREERGHLVERPDGGRQADALRGPLQQLVEPLQREGQVGAALRARDRVHLVEDHGGDAPQRLPRSRGEQQEQRLGRGDEHIGRGTGELAPLVGRGVAGAHADRDVGYRDPQPLCGLPDARER
jgi:hypothetical protein